MEEELTRQQIADHYGVTQTTIFNWVKKGCPSKMKLKKPKVSVRMFVISEIDKWLLESRSRG